MKTQAYVSMNRVLSRKTASVQWGTSEMTVCSKRAETASRDTCLLWPEGGSDSRSHLGPWGDHENKSHRPRMTKPRVEGIHDFLIHGVTTPVGRDEN